MTQALELDSEALASTRPTYVGLNRPEAKHDSVDHPSHYTWLPKGIEVIDITENFNFCRGNALKYILRAGHKGSELEDLRKARWYLDREIARLAEGLT